MGKFVVWVGPNELAKTKLANHYSSS
ncbi:uncharacterized protein G2W53_034190 [Senna tora]|uniref:Uncharacterized protein n=1 Tax=Senna tora TaxID=362788 RepID=A0A834WDI7_9FABA|nr:uncharacterized protein G2W53_034190 [Senna tora]